MKKEIHLRPIRKENLPFIIAVKKNLFYCKMANTVPVFRSSEQQDIISAIEDPNQDYRIIYLNHSPIGFVRLRKRVHEKTGFTIGIADIEFGLGAEFGKGYMTEALSIIGGDFFDNGGSKIFAHIPSQNRPAIALMERLGFTFVGQDPAEKEFAEQSQNSIFLKTA